MNIGKPQRIIEVEPLVKPVPEVIPMPDPDEAPVRERPVEEPMPVPAPDPIEEPAEPTPKEEPITVPEPEPEREPEKGPA